MPSERESNFNHMMPIEFNIADNVFNAYFDANKKLVFVIDYVTSDIKPNALLVIRPVENRKWDDILENDYDVDLETVRPKKDNKYQKLDIEYSGLELYDELLQAYTTGQDVQPAANKLHDFRRMAAHRAASERLADATLVAERADDTIDKTNEKILDLQQQQKDLRDKLVIARHSIGKEPTKQSASKILRLESQVELCNDKLKRAKKRLANAQKRSDNANAEIAVAQNILNILGTNLPASPINTDVAVVTDAPVPANVPENEFINETKADEMADEDVKPLFDTDPNILDEDNAFKPVAFNMDGVQPAPVVADDNAQSEFVAPDVFAPVDVPYASESATETVVQPLSFAPPSTFEAVDVPAVPEEQPSTPMFEGFTPIPVVEESETQTQDWTPQPIVQPTEKPVQDVLAPVTADVTPDVAPAPISSDFRPVSPVSRDDVSAAVPVAVDSVARAKPTMLYYVLLIVLIVMSIFTLWMYQNSTNKNMPELAAAPEPSVTVVEQEYEPQPEPVVESEPVAVEPEIVAEPEPVIVNTDVEPEPVVPTVPDAVVDTVVVPDVEPVAVQVTEPVVETNAEPVAVTEIAEEPVVAEPVVENPFLYVPADAIVGPVPTVEDEEPVAVPTEEEILAAKPAYGVSQQEKMFVADDTYETDAVVTTNTEPTIVRASEVTVASAPEYVAEETLVTESLCSDGNAPDRYGCCSGEEFVLLPDGEQACCAESTGECFPPMEIN